MGDFLALLILELGIGIVAGAVVGYAAKKVAKVLIIILGILTLTLIYLYYKEILTLNSAGLISLVQGAISVPIPNVPAILTLLPFSASFLLGMVIGAKKA